MQEVCQLLEIDKQRTSFYRPETNSIAERFHATLTAMMGRMLSDHQKEWDLLLPHVMAAYSAVDKLLPELPDVRTRSQGPGVLVFDIPVEDPPPSYLRVRPLKFHRGDWVLYFNPRKFQGRQQKWQRKFSPYLVMKELSPVNYLIQKSKRSRPMIAHVDKLKPWNTRSWLTDELPNGGNVDRGWNADDGVVVSSTVYVRRSGSDRQTDGQHSFAW